MVSRKQRVLLGILVSLICVGLSLPSAGWCHKGGGHGGGGHHSHGMSRGARHWHDASRYGWYNRYYYDDPFFYSSPFSLRERWYNDADNIQWMGGPRWYEDVADPALVPSAELPLNPLEIIFNILPFSALSPQPSPPVSLYPQGEFSSQPPKSSSKPKAAQ